MRDAGAGISAPASQKGTASGRKLPLLHSPEAYRAAIEALEAQAEALAFAGNVLGYELPVRPGN